MHIFDVVNAEVQLSEEALLIKPIRDLWLADKTKSKEKFMQQAAIIYFMADPRSSYNYILDDADRLASIIEEEGLPADYTITPKVQEAIDCYKKHIITTSYLLLQSAQKIASKLSAFLDTIDLYAETEKGQMKYPMNVVTSTLKQIPEVVKNLQETEKIVQREIQEQGRARGGNDSKKAFEDGI